MIKPKLTVALIGNPNCGKTTLFNQLTGNSQYVGNWPGVTIEKKEGKVKFEGQQLNILDLPGIYSLSPYSPEEVITRNCLLNDPPNVIINVVDSTNIERNLYLTTQIMELGLPVIIGLNMVDILKRRGDIVSCEQLRKSLNLPIVEISASLATGLETLVRETISLAKQNVNPEIKNIYSPEIDFILQNIEGTLPFGQNSKENSHYTNVLKILLPKQKVTDIMPPPSKRWFSVKLFEDDVLIKQSLNLSPAQHSKIESFKNLIKVSENVDRQMLIADERYKYICSVCSRAIKRKYSANHVSGSDLIDSVLTHNFFALPIFILMIFLILGIVFGPPGIFLKGQIDWLIENPIKLFFSDILNALGASSWSRNLVIDGIITGVGSVISFLPQLVILFAMLSFLEDSGYMVRAAFITDRILQKIGLSGRAFVPMLMGFGCSVPAIMGTRILENKNDKRLTIFMIPFMSCSAKMTVYALFISTFFKYHQPLIILSLYSLGIFIAVISAFFLKKFILKGPNAPFIMELPPYRWPSLKNLWLHVQTRIKDFLGKAGTVLITCSIAIWFLNSFNFKLQMVDAYSSDGMLAQIGSFLAPLFTPCGFNSWKAVVAIVTGFVAREAVVSTLNGLASGQELNSLFSTLSAYSFMTFILLYTPCIAAIGALNKELESRKWTIFAISYQIFIAWLASAIVFQVGRLFC